MRSILSDNHLVHATTELIVDKNEALQHLMLGNKGLDDAQSAQSLVQLGYNVAPLSLNSRRLTFQLTADNTHNPSCDWSYDDYENGKLPTDCEQSEEAYQDGDRLTNEHIDTTGDGVFHYLNVCRHTGNDVTLTLFREEAQRQFQHLLINLNTDITNDTCSEGYHNGRGSEIAKRLDTRHHDECHTHKHQRQEGSIRRNKILYPSIAIIYYDILVQMMPVPRFILINRRIYLEQDIQDGDEHHEREHVHPLGKEVQHNRPSQVLTVWLEVTCHDGEELLQHITFKIWLQRYEIIVNYQLSIVILFVSWLQTVLCHALHVLLDDGLELTLHLGLLRHLIQKILLHK